MENKALKLLTAPKETKIVITSGNGRNSTVWHPQKITIGAFIEQLKNPTRTRETVAEYQTFSKAEKDEVKDTGGYVLGKFKGQKRKKQDLEYRSALALDLDFAKSDTVENIKRSIKTLGVIHSTHSHTKENPRLRLILFLSDNVSSEQYSAISRKIAFDLGLELFDATTFEANRLMFYPSISQDAEYICEELEGDLLDPKSVLKLYADWRNTAEWPTTQREKNQVQQLASKQADPRKKSGLVGAFCRVYDVRDAIEKFLPTVYQESSVPGRYDYIQGSTIAGVVIHDNDLFAYSHHGTDPAGGKLCNAFDLVRIHLFGEKDSRSSEGLEGDKLPSFKAMRDFILEDGAVKYEINTPQATDDFKIESSYEEWTNKLETNNQGIWKTSTANIELILANEPIFRNLVYDTLNHSIAVIGEVCWNRVSETWGDTDDQNALIELSKRYHMDSPDKLATALNGYLSNHRQYNPLKAFLESCPPWEGRIKADDLFIDLFGAEDSAYMRAVGRKFMAALVRRAFEPGCKFDHMLVLVGEPDLGKSMFPRLLVGDKYFADSLSLTEMRDKTGSEKLLGKWIVEISELAGMRKADEEIVKGFISRNADNFRPAYGRRTVDHKRSCLLVGTTNAVEDGFLRDVTGNRKFWPVKVNTKLDFDKFNEAYRLQLFAHALTYYKNENLYLEGALKVEAAKIQESFLEVDVRLGLIEQGLNKLLPLNWSEIPLEYRQVFYGNTKNGLPPVVEEANCKVKRDKVCVLEIWCEMLGNDKERLNRAESNKIIAMLQKLGWERCKSSVEGKTRVKLYGSQKIFIRK